MRADLRRVKTVASALQSLVTMSTFATARRAIQDRTANMTSMSVTLTLAFMGLAHSLSLSSMSASVILVTVETTVLRILTSARLTLVSTVAVHKA